MRGRRLRGALLLCLLPAAGCLRTSGPIGIELRETTRFESEWKHYRKLPSFKSFAVAGDPDGLHVSGYAYARPGRGPAIDGALAYCEQRRADRRIAGECRTYAVDDERVDGPSLEVETTFLSD